MKEIICPKCKNVIEEAGTKFCPQCGADIQAAIENWTCKNCGEVNSAEAGFCKACGESRDKQNKFFYSANFKYALAIVLVVLIGGFGSYSYFNSLNEDKYLTNYAAAARDLNEVNSGLINNVKIETLKSGNAQTLTEQMKTQKDILDSQIKIFSDMRPFKNYDNQHADLIALLHKKSEIVGQVMQVISNPLDSTAETAIEKIKANTSDAKALEEQIKVPNATFISNVNLASVPEQLSIFVAEQKKINLEKMEKLAVNQEFFRKMDDEIHRYDGAKSDLGKLLENNKKSGMIWSDYFNVLDRAKSERISIRNSVNEIVAPPEAENLKRDFRAVLDDSISYCELMREAANLGFNNYYLERMKKENAADEINNQVQSEYATFIGNYNSVKSRLLNVANL